MKQNNFLFFIVLLFIFLSQMSYAATLNVGQESSYTTVMGAIADASDGDTILIVDAVHTECGIIIDKNITLAGIDSQSSILQGHETKGMAADRVITVLPENEVFIKNITIKHGKTKLKEYFSAWGDLGDDGGGIYNEGNLELTDCIISDNVTAGGEGSSYIGGAGGYGAGIYNAGTITIKRCEIINNKTGDGAPGGQNGYGGSGGGIHNTGTLNIYDSTIGDNITGSSPLTGYGGGAGSGGGISNRGIMTVSGCIITGNSTGDQSKDAYDRSAGSGGGIINLNEMVIENSSVINNTADSKKGGGIYNEGIIEVNNVSLESNIAGRGGGFYNSNQEQYIEGGPLDSSVTISGSTLRNNRSKEGGGIYNSAYMLICNKTLVSENSTVADSSFTFSGDIYRARGGGIFNADELVVENSIISNNTTDDGIMPCYEENGDGGNGAGIYNIEDLTIRNTLFLYNITGVGLNALEEDADGLNSISSGLIISDPCAGYKGRSGNGAAIYNNGTISAFGCTFYGNSTGYGDIGNDTRGTGGGVYSSSYAASVIIKNSIFWNNAPNEIQIVSDDTDSSIVYNDIEGGYPGEGNIDIDPLFVDPEAEDFHLTGSSRCIDNGFMDASVNFDIDNETRPVGRGYDIGAYEYYHTSITNPVEEAATLQLKTRWNMISLSNHPKNTSIESVLNSISGKYKSIWAYNGSSWDVYDPVNIDFSDLSTMEAGKGYWINMAEAAQMIFTGVAYGGSVSLKPGWNLIGARMTNPMRASEVFYYIEDELVSVWGFEDGDWEVYTPENPEFNDLNMIEPGKGYWVNVKRNCTWVLP